MSEPDIAKAERSSFTKVSDVEASAESAARASPDNATDLRGGTFHQTQVQATGIGKTRKHFFSPLSSTLADAVNRDAEAVEYTLEEEVCCLNASLSTIYVVVTSCASCQRAVARKIDFRVLSLVVSSYICA